MAKKKRQQATKRSVESGHLASSSGKALRTYDVGALPIINRILERMRLADILKQCLPADDPRACLRRRPMGCQLRSRFVRHGHSRNGTAQ
jgi:hypothetical protein